MKIHAVKLVIEGGNIVAETARQLDLSPKTLHKWVNGYNEDSIHSSVGNGNLRPEEQAL